MLVALHRTSLTFMLVLSASFLLGFSGRVQAKSVVSASNNAVIPSHKRTFLPRSSDGNLMTLVRGGMSTIPVESAAGMAFGFWCCVLASTAGRLMGVAISFLLRRSLMKDWVRRQLQGNKIMDLLDETVQVGPLRVATMVRYSFLPEFAVNYGCAILEPIRLWMILLATVVHSVPFSCLWAWIRVDTALQLQNNNNVVLPNRTLQVTVVVAGIVGFLLTPLLMTWWL